MKHTTSAIAIFLLSIAITIVSSCQKEDNDPVRTLEMEMEELDAFLADLVTREFDIDTSDLGIYYIVRAGGDGALAQVGDSLSLEYTGYFLDGQIFDGSAYHYPDSTWEFVFKEDQLIQGFEEGISLMNKGAEIDMIIPSEFAYGPHGYGSVGPYTTLLFLTKLHDIIPASD